jgi:hypothetical protein
MARAVLGLALLGSTAFAETPTHSLPSPPRASDKDRPAPRDFRPVSSWTIRVLRLADQSQLQIEDRDGVRRVWSGLLFWVDDNEHRPFRLDAEGGQVCIRRAAASPACRFLLKLAPWTPQVVERNGFPLYGEAEGYRGVRYIASEVPDPDGRESFRAQADSVLRGGDRGEVLTLRGNSRLCWQREGRGTAVTSDRIVVNLLTGSIETGMGDMAKGLMPPLVPGVPQSQPDEFRTCEKELPAPNAEPTNFTFENFPDLLPASKRVSGANGGFFSSVQRQ